MAELKSTEINGNLILNGELQPQNNELRLPENAKIFVGETEFQGSGSTSIDIGGENLGLVKNGGNVTIDEEGQMNAELGWKTVSITDKPQIYAGDAVGSIIEGVGTSAGNNPYQHVQGKYNLIDEAGDYAIIVGNGDTQQRSNAYTLDWDGNGWYGGDLEVNGILNVTDHINANGDIEGDQIRANKLIVNEIIIGDYWIHIDENNKLIITYQGA